MKRGGHGGLLYKKGARIDPRRCAQAGGGGERTRVMALMREGWAAAAVGIGGATLLPSYFIAEMVWLA